MTSQRWAAKNTGPVVMSVMDTFGRLCHFCPFSTLLSALKTYRDIHPAYCRYTGSILESHCRLTTDIPEIYWKHTIAVSWMYAQYGVATSAVSVVCVVKVNK